MDHSSKIYVTGHNGLVGSALIRSLEKSGYKNLITRSRDQMDLSDGNKVENFFKTHTPEYVFLCAAKVGGIFLNQSKPAEFIRENLLIQTNIIHSASQNNTKKLCFLGSASCYPENAPSPIKENSFMTGQLDSTNSAYSISKIAGYVMCQKYSQQYDMETVTVFPNNIYGKNDNFRINECHVVPSLIRKFIEAKETKQDFIKLKGDGTAVREFIYGDDLADGLIFLMNNYDDRDHINITSGKDVTIRQLAEIIKNIVNFNGKIYWDKASSAGKHSRVLDNTKLSKLGWQSSTSLENGLRKTIKWFLENRNKNVRF
jgi:GDP-L-fucose synthase